MFEALPADTPLLPGPAPTFSIADYRTVDPLRPRLLCPRGRGDEIIVCGWPGRSRYRLPPLPSLSLPSRDPDMPFGFDLPPNVRVGGTRVEGNLSSGNGIGLRIRC